MTAVRLAAAAAIGDGEARRFDIDGVPVCVVRIGDRLFAVGDTCSHAEFSLSDGEVWPDECAIECPKHGASFSLTTGEPLSLPATRPVAVYPVRIDGDNVVVEVPAGE
jgi:3-phenylpropionate/trans-cinnamate dioxygenase ferredoxin subunit